MVKFVKASAIIFFVLLALFHAFVRKLVFGWIVFLQRVIPQVDINLEILLQAMVAIVLLLIGGHSLLKWIYEHRTQKQWHKKWTLGLVITTILLFVGGTASVGIATFGESTAQHGITSGYISYSHDFFIMRLSMDHKTITRPQKNYIRRVYEQLRKVSLNSGHTQRNFFNSFYENFQYVFVISRDSSLSAVIRIPLPNNETNNITFVRLWRKGEFSQRKLYDQDVTLDQLIAYIENGTIPPGSIR